VAVSIGDERTQEKARAAKIGGAEKTVESLSAGAESIVDGVLTQTTHHDSPRRL
jgi:hypothetical protein